MTAQDVKKALQQNANPQRALVSQRFFKTGQGEYGEGDVFIGCSVPTTRAVCKQFITLPLGEVQYLLDSHIHEHRLCGALLLTYQYPKADAACRKAIYDFYLANVLKGNINNWDIIDTSAEFIVGRYLYENDLPRDILFTLAHNDNMWQKRTAILSSFYFFQKGSDPTTTLELAELLLYDKRDLIQKAVGWMLREVGKRVDTKLLTDFLDAFAATMPRTTLRYATEHLAKDRKMAYLAMAKVKAL